MLSAVFEVMITRSPALKKAFAKAKPMPLAPPVINTILSANTNTLPDAFTLPPNLKCSFMKNFHLCPFAHKQWLQELVLIFGDGLIIPMG